MTDASDGATNLAPLSVSDLAGALKRTIEDRFGYVRVRGEISGFRGPHSSGHCYFSLKDQNARIDAVIWKPVYARMKVRPEEGVEVIATRRITTFPGKSAYQIIIDQIELAGLGALMALLEKRRQALAAEGLFDAARKRPLPFLPAVVGVVTSPTGAVIRDILHRLADRFPRRVLVWPVRVQGEGSAQEVAAAIAGFNALGAAGGPPRPDVLIVARGGGSLEDLWGFNEEIVVRAAAESAIPLISAVGHETDTTLIDLAADIRAPTPTAAAELAVPVRLDLLRQIGELGARGVGALIRLAAQRRRERDAAARLFDSRADILAPRRQALDGALDRWELAASRDGMRRRDRLGTAVALLETHRPVEELRRRREALASLGRRLEARAPEAARLRERLAGYGERLRAGFVSATRLSRQRRAQDLARAGERLAAALRGLGETRRARLAAAGQMLDSLSYERVLARGYAVVWEGRRPLRRAGDVRPGAAVTLQFADGRVAATAGDRQGGAGEEASRPLAGPPPRAASPRRPRKPEPGPAGQGDLF
ncbi:MAG: exodeoxyribonuclease VII large subunit [Rhizobiales bacterium]|nr:exodeoxyribonuclease VII large subunit [Hyphomicrobiales bacterium]